MQRLSTYLPFVAAMALIVLASNVLVEFPLQGQVGPLSLADILTWGAFAYPFSFLVKTLPIAAGPRGAAASCSSASCLRSCARSPCRRCCSNMASSGSRQFDRLARIAIASGTAFLTAQLLDVTVFNWLRKRSWWRAPIFGSLAGSVVDTAIFFTIAFAAAFSLMGPNDAFALEPAPLMGVLAAETARWISWAGDLR